MQKLVTAIILLTYSLYSSAHPGHDHSAADATAIHFVFAASIVSIIVIAAYLAFKTYTKAKDKKQ